jgi:predicted RNase H-like HicB family nuclease
MKGLAMTYKVLATWDAEAKVWVATSDDILGLATEAETFERLVERVIAVVPELLELNHQTLDAGSELTFEAVRREQLAGAA